MKRLLIWLCLFVLVLQGAACAECVRIEDSLFDTAKLTLHCLDVGDYAAASSLLGFTDAGSLQTLAQNNFTALGSGTAQTRVAVAFVQKSNWYLAIPTQEPEVGVETLLLDCGSGTAICNVMETDWGQVQMAVDSSANVIWNEEAGTDVIVIPD